jgi:hypothetical protein
MYAVYIDTEIRIKYNALKINKLKGWRKRMNQEIPREKIPWNFIKECSCPQNINIIRSCNRQTNTHRISRSILLV